MLGPRRYGLLFLALFGFAGPAAAQTADTQLAKLQTYMSRPDFSNELQYIVREFEKPRRGACSRVSVTRVDHLPITPIAFNAQGVPVQGDWRTQITVSRCGAPVIHNVLYQARNGKIVPNGMFPGLTRTPLQMQDGVAVNMRNFLSKTLPADDCRLFVIMDTNIERQPSTTSPSGWTERWSIQQCSRLDDVLIDFSIAPSGEIVFRYRLG